MADTSALLEALKQVLKGRGKTYRDVARELALSEASVKRLFSKEDFTLKRLEQVCAFLDVSFADLVRHVEAGQADVTELTDNQEKELVSDRKLLLIAVLVVNGWTFEQILSDYRLSEQEVVRHLARLDRLQIIDLLPKNRVHLRISRNFTWRKGGAIEQFYERLVPGEFLRSRFDGPNELMRFVFGVLSHRSIAVMHRRLEQVVREFNELHQEDVRLSAEKRQGMSVLLAIRGWELSVFADLHR